MASRRFPLLPVVASTALAFAAAVGVYVLFGDDDGGGPEAGEALDLQPTGEMPASPAEVRLAGLGDEPDGTLGDYLGTRPVVVNFFASWCVPCLEEMPAFEAVHQDLGDEVTIVGLATSDSEGRALDMVERTGVTYPAFADADTSAIGFFGGTQMPTTVFIDAAGEVVSVESRAFDEDELRGRIGELLGVPA